MEFCKDSVYCRVENSLWSGIRVEAEGLVRRLLQYSKQEVIVACAKVVTEKMERNGWIQDIFCR